MARISSAIGVPKAQEAFEKGEIFQIIPSKDASCGCAADSRAIGAARGSTGKASGTRRTTHPVGYIPYTPELFEWSSPVDLAFAVGDSTFGQIIRRQFDSHLVAGHDADEMLAPCGRRRGQ